MADIQIQKRNGKVILFDPQRITNAIFKAVESVGGTDFEQASQLSGLVQDYVILQDKNLIDIEEIQDMIEKVLIEEGHAKTAKSFILYRQKRKEMREAKSSTGVVDDCKLSLNAIKVLKARYLLKDENGKIIESPGDLFKRVAKTVASIEEKYGCDPLIAEKTFCEVMMDLNFLPNSPLLMNAGTKNAQLSSTFVLPIADTTEGVFSTLKNAATIHKRGGGTGFSFSRIRPRGDKVNQTFGAASGPLAFLSIYDNALEKIKQQGKRAGANMAVLRIDHPDILDFITCKESRDLINNFNLSVGITDEFIHALKNSEEYDLINPRNNDIVGRLNAKSTFDLLSTMAWKNGDPGIIFLDRINNKRSNPTPSLGLIETTSSCGEQPLQPYESAILGSINLSNHVTRESSGHDPFIDWEKLKITIHTAVHFLDNATDINEFHLPEIAQRVRKTRKIGLGVMGFADMLIKLRIAYNSSEAFNTADQVMQFIDNEARKASCKLAKTRGVFPYFEESILKNYGEEFHTRNATRTTISPTGTLSIIASCSPSIEPLFALSYLRKTAQFEMLEVNPLFEEVAKEEGFYSEDLLRKIALSGTLKDIDEVPNHIKEIFVTAMDLSPETHVAMQAAFQKHVDAAVSKTVNFPYSATVEDVKKVFELAYDLGCKGITIYRDGSRTMQVLTSFKREYVKEQKNEPKDEDKETFVYSSNNAPTIHKKLHTFR
jgi:ribonucleoside-diphosphate reductase alpha chain